MAFLKRFSLLVSSCFLALQAVAFDNDRDDNVAVYWGQNSYGNRHPDDPANYQQRISAYCQDDAIDAIPIAFVDVFFSTGNYPEINLANICGTWNGVFPGTNLANCSFLAPDIEACQARGKITTISLGGATGGTVFSSDAQAEAFADTIWNIFLGGSSPNRPFGNTLLDGVDLDIEAGSSTGYAAFVNRIRSHAEGATKRYYVTAAPQCVFPDDYLGPALNAASFDAVYVQFYNNWCGLQNYDNPNAWNFWEWDNWAKTKSLNPNVKVYIGAPASSTAAGSGYVDIGRLGQIALETRSRYSSFGGVMLWDASQAVANNRYDLAIKNIIRDSGAITTPTSGRCAGVPAWRSDIAYHCGSQVTYSGHLWVAKWWSQADVPGGSAGDWTNLGPCPNCVAATQPIPAGPAHKSDFKATFQVNYEKENTLKAPGFP